MPNSTRPRCLLIAPLTFYSFHSTLAAALEKRGYSVDLLNEEFPSNAFGKIFGKLALPILRITTLIGLKRRLAQQQPYDLVLIIKGRGLGAASIRFLYTRAQRIVGYNFDSFRYNPSALDWRHLVDRYATFDVEDSRKQNLPLVHLFSAVQDVDIPAKRRYDLSIVQRVHSKRLVYAAKMLDALPDGARSFVFLYQSSKLLFLFSIACHPLLYRKLWQHIYFKPLSHAEAMSILAESQVTFDYAHPHQSGITVRCFEAQSLGTGIITNNQFAVESGMFSGNEIVYLPHDATTEVVREALAVLAHQTTVSKTRSLDDFLDDLLKHPTKAQQKMED